MTADPNGLVATIIATLERMPAADRALSAAALIAAVQGEGDRRIARIRWGAITEMYDGGMTKEEIAATLDTSSGTVDLALQSHHRSRSVPV